MQRVEETPGLVPFCVVLAGRLKAKKSTEKAGAGTKVQCRAAPPPKKNRTGVPESAVFHWFADVFSGNRATDRDISDMTRCFEYS